MQKVKIIALGKLTEKFAQTAAEMYTKRLARHYAFSVTEIKVADTPQNPSDGDIRRSLDTEAQRILEAIPPRARVVAMCVEGKPMSSEALARYMDSAATEGASEVVFLIGSSHGLSDKVKERADLKLSVSEMTFPHELFRVMLMEQIYRAGEINIGSKYHK